MGFIKRTFAGLLLAAITLTASAQDKGSAGLLSHPRPLPPTSPVEKQQHAKLFSSYVAPLGTIGRTGRYQIVVVKVRGLDTPNVAGFLIYDSETDQLVGAQTGVAPGLGTALVNGGANVAGSYLFGSRLRPSSETVNSSAGSDSVAVGNGGNSNATGGNGGNGGNGGSGGNGGAGGGQHVPPGHINNPGHGH
jgi:hypothetical protein